MLFVFPVSISFCKAISFSMIEIACWNVSMTSTNSASDLLNSFAPFLGEGGEGGFTVFVDTVGDMLVDLFLARDISDFCDVL